MKFLRRHWYEIGGIVAIGAIVCLVIFWNQMDILRRLMLMSFAAFLLHEFEEYRFPGGFPAVWNIVFNNSDVPDRYPLNQNSTMIVNLMLAYIVYLLPVLFPNVIWLGLAPILMGLTQFFVHGIVLNTKMKSLYNPGLAVVVFIQIPLGIYYIWHITSNGLAQGVDWLLAVVYMILATGATLGWLLNRLARRDSKFRFDEVEMSRFDVPGKLKRVKGEEEI